MLNRAAATVVSPFEADLLTILQGFLGHVPRSQTLPLLLKAQPRPRCLSGAAVSLVEDTLAKGVTQLLAREGWRRERFLRAGEISDGLLWSRSPPQDLALSFCSRALDFLMWATATPLNDQGAAWQFSDDAQLSLGTHLLLVLAFDAVRGTAIEKLWSHRKPWRNDGLCRLLFADSFEPSRTTAQVEFTPWLKPAGVAVLEAWQRRLADRWVEMELARPRAESPARVASTGRSQAVVLNAFCNALDRVGRRDLARFLLVALRRLQRPEMTISDWLGPLQLGDLRLAERQQVYREALALPQLCPRLESWQRHARGVGYFDEDYQAAQLWKSVWESYNGDSLMAMARGLLDETRWI